MTNDVDASRTAWRTGSTSTDATSGVNRLISDAAVSRASRVRCHSSSRAARQRSDRASTETDGSVDEADRSQTALPRSALVVAPSTTPRAVVGKVSTTRSASPTASSAASSEAHSALRSPGRDRANPHTGVST